MTAGDRARFLPAPLNRLKWLTHSELRASPADGRDGTVRLWDDRVPWKTMARGWESKSIESQQEDAAGAKVRGPELTAAERDRLQQRRSLELALAQTQAELIAACRAAHRDMLQGRLAAIRQALDDLS